MSYPWLILEQIIDELSLDGLLNIYHYSKNTLSPTDIKEFDKKILSYLILTDLKTLGILKTLYPDIKHLINGEIKRRINSNELIKILEAFPDKPYDLRYAVTNPNFTWNYVMFNPQINWGEYSFGLSQNPIVTQEIVELNPNFNWRWDGLCRNPNFNCINVKNLKELDWRSISQNANTTMEYIENNPDKPWHYLNISINPNLTYDFLRKHLPYKFDWTKVSKNVSIPWDLVLSKKNKDNIDLEIIKKLDFYALSSNPRITWKNILKNPNYRWNANEVLLNPNFSTENFAEYEDFFRLKPDLEIFAQNINFDWTEKILNPDINWSNISLNPNLSLEKILENPENPNWNWNLILTNLFTKDPNWLKLAYKILSENN